MVILSAQSVLLEKERSWRACFFGAAMSTVPYVDARAPQGPSWQGCQRRHRSNKLHHLKPLHFHSHCHGPGTWFLLVNCFAPGSPLSSLPCTVLTILPRAQFNSHFIKSLHLLPVATVKHQLLGPAVQALHVWLCIFFQPHFAGFLSIPASKTGVPANRALTSLPAFACIPFLSCRNPSMLNSMV